LEEFFRPVDRWRRSIPDPRKSGPFAVNLDTFRSNPLAGFAVIGKRTNRNFSREEILTGRG